MFPRCSFDTFALVRACGAGGNAHKQRQLPKTTDTSCECAAGGVPKLSTVVLPILLLLWRVTGTMRSIEFPTPCLQIPIPGDLIGQPFLLRRLGNDRQTLLCAVSIRLQQEALVTPLNNFNAGWLLRHHRIWFFAHLDLRCNRPSLSGFNQRVAPSSQHRYWSRRKLSAPLLWPDLHTATEKTSEC